MRSPRAVAAAREIYRPRQAIGADAVGFAAIEVLRTSLGFAGARDAGRRIADADALAAYQARAVELATECMLARDRRGEGGGMAHLLAALARLARS